MAHHQKKNNISQYLSHEVTTVKPGIKESRHDMEHILSPGIGPVVTTQTKSSSTTKFQSSNSTADSSVLSSVLKRVGALEESLDRSRRKLKQALIVIKEKDNEIIRLKEQIRLTGDQLSKQNNFATQSEFNLLFELSKSLQSRVTAVETSIKSLPNLKPEISNDCQYCKCKSENVKPDLDLLLQQITELNFEAGEVHIYNRTKQGASFQSCHSKSLTFYANGMQLEGHPFREYSDLRTQYFVKDILDGYFPSELQYEYPRGVIFNVLDRRNDYYNEEKDRKNHIFKGHGHKLDVRNDKSSETEVKKKKSNSCYEEITAHKNKNNLYVCNTPVTHVGNNSSATQVIEIHNKDFYKNRRYELLAKASEIYSFEGIGGGDGNFMYRDKKNLSDLPDVTFRNAKKTGHESLTKIKYLNPGTKITDSSDSSVQLKIRSVDSKKLYILVMKTNESVRKLRSFLPNEVKDCDILQYNGNSKAIHLTDNDCTLKEYGIVKNSVLVLSKPKLEEK